MWDLPGPGPEPVSAVLAGRLLTTVPPGKPNSWPSLMLALSQLPHTLTLPPHTHTHTTLTQAHTALTLPFLLMDITITAKQKYAIFGYPGVHFSLILPKEVRS